jgi:hypothetical protein
VGVKPLRVFYSYSHKDERMLERLRNHMAMLRRQGLITEWYDRGIDAGGQWRNEIERELEAADVILLLVSANFLASDFCYEKEMTRAVDRARRGDALVIGVMLRPVRGWEDTPFAAFQVVPRDARPISRWSDADEGYCDAVEKIRAALSERAAAASHRGSRARRSRADGKPQVAKPPHPTKPDEVGFTQRELAILDRIEDPAQREFHRQTLIVQKKRLLAQSLEIPDDVRRDMLKAVAQNFRA